MSKDPEEQVGKKEENYLDVIPSMVVTTFSEQSVRNHPVHVQFVQHRISVL